ncbi:MAG: hypothetical protein ACKN89_05265 [Cyanobium sp.]
MLAAPPGRSGIDVAIDLAEGADKPEMPWPETMDPPRCGWPCHQDGRASSDPRLRSHRAEATLSFQRVSCSSTATKVRLGIRSPLEQMASRAGHDLIARTLQPRVYRLIDGLLEPHPYLDGLYDSIEEAFRDVCEWLESLGPVTDAASNIGLEVRTPDGGWRTIRHPALIACPLACLALS